MQDFIITVVGQELMAKMIAGTSTCKFLKVCTSDYDYSGVDLENLSELQGVKQTSLISSVTRTDNTLVNLMALVDNSQLSEDYYVRALGLYAEDIDANEVLYAISIETDNPDHLPAFSRKTVSSITYSMNIRVDNSSQVILEVNPLGVPTVEQVEAIRSSIDAHMTLSACAEEGIHGLRYWNGKLQAYNAETKAWESEEADSALSDTSEKPIQNKVVKAALDDKGPGIHVGMYPPSDTSKIWVKTDFEV